MKIAVAFDHRGVSLREAVLRGARGPRGDRPRHRHAPRFGSTTRTRRARSARRSSAARPSAAILVCGSGAGAAIAACKMTGIRAAICHDLYSAHQAVEHDDMNVLCLGSEIVGASVARELVAVFLAAQFDGGERYVARLEKVAAMEKEMKRWPSRGCMS